MAFENLKKKLILYSQSYKRAHMKKMLNNSNERKLTALFMTKQFKNDKYCTRDPDLGQHLRNWAGFNIL